MVAQARADSGPNGYGSDSVWHAHQAFCLAAYLFEQLQLRFTRCVVRSHQCI